MIRPACICHTLANLFADFGENGRVGGFHMGTLKVKYDAAAISRRVKLHHGI